MGDTQKGQLREKTGINSMWTCGQKDVGRAVYSLEEKDKDYESNVHFQ